MRHNEYLLDKSYFEKVAALFNKGQSDPQKILVGCKLIPETTFKRGYNE